jgi:hypothetical protein
MVHFLPNIGAPYTCRIGLSSHWNRHDSQHGTSPWRSTRKLCSRSCLTLFSRVVGESRGTLKDLLQGSRQRFLNLWTAPLD